MQVLNCPNCGAPLGAPAEGQRIVRCAFCQETIELEAPPEAPPPDPPPDPPADPPPPPPAPRSGGGAVGTILFISACVLVGLAIFVVAQRADRGDTAVPHLSFLGSSAAPSRPDIDEGPVTLTWSARLVSATGSAPPAGSPCTLTASVTSDGKDADEQMLTLECRGHVLYDSRVPLSGMSSSRFGIGEEPVAGEASAFRYELAAQDVGSRAPPRAQIIVETPKGTLDAFADGAPMFRVHATIDHFSAVRRGKALLARSVPPFDHVVTRTARVVSKTGAVPFATPTCRLVISPGYAKDQTCRVELECGGRAVYGGADQGFDDCVIADRQPRSLVDPAPTPSDGDPELRCDLAAGTATLGDTSKSGATYSVRFALSDEATAGR